MAFMVSMFLTRAIIDCPTGDLPPAGHHSIVRIFLGGKNYSKTLRKGDITSSKPNKNTHHVCTPLNW
jgi:hypothetical protein